MSMEFFFRKLIFCKIFWEHFFNFFWGAVQIHKSTNPCGEGGGIPDGGVGVGVLPTFYVLIIYFAEVWDIYIS